MKVRLWRVTSIDSYWGGECSKVVNAASISEAIDKAINSEDEDFSEFFTEKRLRSVVLLGEED